MPLTARQRPFAGILRKATKQMKRQILLILIMAVAAGATACQKTPEELVVKQKDGEALMEAIKDSDSSSREKNQMI